MVAEGEIITLPELSGIILILKAETDKDVYGLVGDGTVDGL